MSNSSDTGKHFRIYTENGFVFDISIEDVYVHRNKFLFNKDTPPIKFMSKVMLITLMDYVKKLNWSDIVDNLEFVGIIESPHVDLLSSSQIDIVESPLPYKHLFKQKLKLKIIK